MALIQELRVTYHCDECGDDFTVDYMDLTDVEEDLDHSDGYGCHDNSDA